MAAVDAALRVNEQGRTVSSWIDDWVETYKKPKVSPKRMQAIGYEVNRIKAAIGMKPLKAVTQADLQRIVNTRIGLSRDAINRTAGMIKAIFKSAVQNRLLPYSPAELLEIPKGKTGTHRELKQDEIDIVIKAAKTGHRFGVAAMVMLFAGLRRAESAELHKEKDIAKDMISVSRSLEVCGEPGTGQRSLNQTPAAVLFPSCRPSSLFLDSLEGYVIKRRSDGPLSLTSLRKSFASFLRLCSKIAGHPVSFRCHDLRHTYATMLYDAGVDIKTAQRWLGHSTPALTIKLYTHISETRQDKSIKAASAYTSKIAGSISGSIKKRYRLKSK